MANTSGSLTLTLYHHPASFFSQRTRLAFAEKNINFKATEVAIHAGEHLEPWYVRLNPLMTVPAITVEDGTKFIDSEAIIAFVDQVTPELPPFFPDEKTSEGEACIKFIKLFKTFLVEEITMGTMMDPQYTKGFKPFFGPKAVTKSLASRLEQVKRYSEKYPDLRYEYLNKAMAVQERLDKLTTEGNLKINLDAIDSALTEVEAELAKTRNEHQDDDKQPWLCSENFTAADIYLATILHRLNFIGYAHFWTEGKRPSVEAYYQRVLQRESFRKSCLHANNMFWSVTMPMMRYKAKRAAPWLLSASVVVTVAVGIYIYYRKH